MMFRILEVVIALAGLFIAGNLLIASWYNCTSTRTPVGFPSPSEFTAPARGFSGNAHDRRLARRRLERAAKLRNA
jgi:hypothetical protein